MNSRKPIRVVVADDHPVVRSGIRSLLEHEDDLEVVGEAGTGVEALKLVASREPDVLVLDMEMPGLSGVEVARRIRAAGLPVFVLALSAHDNDAYVRGLLEIGAAGYITKEKPLEMITEAVRAVAHGEGRWFIQPGIPEPTGLPISEREREVLRLMAHGLSNQEIAERLHISTNTVRNHIASIYSKLEVGSWREAVAWAWQNRLIDGPCAGGD